MTMDTHDLVLGLLATAALLVLLAGPGLATEGAMEGGMEKNDSMEGGMEQKPMPFPGVEALAVAGGLAAFAMRRKR